MLVAHYRPWNCEMNLFQKIRDSLYNIVDSEGGFILHFFADLIRGGSPKYRQQKRAEQSQKPLNRSQQKIFDEMLKRRQNESQIAYWKRKKAMLNLADKETLVQKEILSRKHQAQQHKKQQSREDIQAQRQQEMQMKRIRMARYSSSQQEHQ